MDFKTVTKPEHRGTMRSYLGKEYFIMKRRMRWLKEAARYAKVEPRNCGCTYSLIKHRSMLLRPLKDIDMVLQHNKITNLRLAISKINGVVIKPGQKFSIWKLVGRPTKGKGYLEGLILHNGQTLRGTGGGLCQLGNLIYWMALHSPLDVTERWRHSFDVFPDVNRKIPFACGATLSYNYVDLQLTNNTRQSFRLNLWLDKEYLNGELFSDTEATSRFEVFETDHQIQQQWWGGYTRHNKIWKRRLNLQGEVLGEDLVTENHAIMMYNPLLRK
ncbi:vancomycin resistance protein VanW [Dysgonomonas sp. PH5-45]|uniref:VanW family protein n=1 Tax=unclassified Dysgonomonas TaxID=2630389 RepID=UPI0024771C9A|nr:MULTISPECIES: VanW family protein [unclassified Dysgonomonas]MDH6353749.1 vancomycin resistance protein VanW [Dysgonomonas sp. PH5-45]MDH6386652.1 vancomycin resistance protein VanW [Dysgonomonas sp. PH5-37]